MPPFHRHILSIIIIGTILIALLAQPLASTIVQAQLGEPLGEIVFVSDRDGDFDIYVMNGEGGQIRQLTNDDASDTNPRWSPDGSQIAFLSNRDDHGDNRSLYVMDADGQNLQSLSTDDIGLTDYNFDWSPDGSKITFAFDPNYVSDFGTPFMEIYSVDIATGHITQLTENEYIDYNPQWSPDNSQIAFSTLVEVEPGGGLIPDLFVMDADGNNVQRLTESPSADLDPNWSSDGSQILFVAYSVTNTDILLVHTQNGRISVVSDLELGDTFYPQWSPDETLVLLVIRHGATQRRDLGLLSINDDSYHILAENVDTAFSADWSPDGTKIVYVSDADENNELYIINPDGTGNKRLTDNEFTESSPQWRPTQD